MPHRTVYDFTTGETTQVELTPEEIAADEARAAAQPAPVKPSKADLLAQLQALAAKIEAMP